MADEKHQWYKKNVTAVGDRTKNIPRPYTFALFSCLQIYLHTLRVCYRGILCRWCRDQLFPCPRISRYCCMALRLRPHMLMARISTIPAMNDTQMLVPNHALESRTRRKYKKRAHNRPSSNDIVRSTNFDGTETLCRQFSVFQVAWACCVRITKVLRLPWPYIKP